MHGEWTNAQNLRLDLGFGFGAARSDGNIKDKGEVAFSLIKQLEKGSLGLDFAFGGTLNPYGNTNIDSVSSNEFNADPSENRFTSIALLYRYPVGKLGYLEPRLGYSDLNRYFPIEEDRLRVSSSNLTWGLGVGVTLLERFNLSFRYQYMGRTPSYEGINTNFNIDGESIDTLIRQRSASYNLFIFRVSYAIYLDKIFKPNTSSK